MHGGFLQNSYENADKNCLENYCLLVRDVKQHGGRHPRRQQVNKDPNPKLATVGSSETSLTGHRTVIFKISTVKNPQSQSSSVICGAALHII